MYKELVDRPYVKAKTKVHGLIAKERCWHFDAWIYRDAFDITYLYVRTRAGGRKIKREYLWQIIPCWDGVLELLELIPDTAKLSFMTPVCINVELLGQYNAYNDLHWRLIQPMSRLVPTGFFPHPSTSVRFHYIDIPMIQPFPDGFANYFKYELREPHWTKRLTSGAELPNMP